MKAVKMSGPSDQVTIYQKEKIWDTLINFYIIY